MLHHFRITIYWKTFLTCRARWCQYEEIQIRVLKGLYMLSTGWLGCLLKPHIPASETLEHASRADHIDSDRYLIKSIYYNLFGGEDSNENHNCGASYSVVGNSRAKHLRGNGRLLCAERTLLTSCYVSLRGAGHYLSLLIIFFNVQVSNFGNLR